MTRFYRFAKTFSILMAFLATTTFAFAANDVDLKFNLKKGDVTKYRATIDQTTTQSMGGVEQKVLQNQIFEYSIDVKDIDSNGNFITQITYTRVAINMSAGGMNMAFDSDDKSAPANPQFMGFGALIGKSINTTFSSKGKIIEVSGVDAMIDTMINELAGDNETIKAQVKQSLGQSFNDEQMKQMFGGSFIEYPSKLIKVGTKWTENQTISNQFTLNVINNYVVKGVDADFVNLDVTSTIATTPGNKSNMQGMDVTFNLFGTQTGTIKIDIKSGKIIESSVNQNISGSLSADMGGQNMDIPMTIASKVFTEIIK
ncbi:MAG: DUF6263 family protein [Bacteroidales bacterium]|nr:DUF6263 family protein [Bacteroidales bacterium]MDD4383774.1 DUF6263 family protein [Bacteroidales bacterium]